MFNIDVTKFLRSLFGVLTLLIAINFSAVGQDANSPEEWAINIANLLPTDPSLNVVESPTEEMLRQSSLKSLRHYYLDVLSERLTFPREEILKFYSNKANDENSHLDKTLVELYRVSGQPSRLKDFEELDKFLIDENWFVVSSAYLEKARHYYYYDAAASIRYLVKALLQVPPDGQSDLINEAKYNIAVMAQALTSQNSGLNDAFNAAEILLELSVDQDRIVDRWAIVYHLSYIHQRQFNGESTDLVTRALITHAQTQSIDRRLAALGVHAYLKRQTQNLASELDLLKSGEKLVDQDKQGYQARFFLDGLAHAYIDSGDIENAEKTREKIKEILSRFGEIQYDSFLNQLEARIAFENQEYEQAYKFQKNYSDQTKREIEYFKQVYGSILDLAFINRLNPKIDSSNLTRLPNAEIIYSKILEQNNTSVLKAFREFQGSLEVYRQDKSSDPEFEKRFMDAVFKRTPESVSEALDDLLSVLNRNDDENIELSEVFKAFVKGDQELASINVEYATNHGYLQLLQAVTAVRDGDYEAAFSKFSRAQQIAEVQAFSNSTFRFNLSELALILAEQGGNPEMVLNAAEDYLQYGRASDQDKSIVNRAGSAAIRVLETAGYFDQAFELAGTLQKSAQANGLSLSESYLFKGRGLNRQGEYSDAVLFLQNALEEVSTLDQELVVLRELFVALAGAVDTDRALETRKSLRISQNKINDPVVDFETSQYLKWGDYLLAVATNSDRADELYREWKDSEAQFIASRHRYFSSQKDKFLRVSQSSAEENVEREISKQSELNDRVSDIRWWLLLFMVLFLITVGLLLRTVLLTKKLNLQEAHYQKASRVKGQFLNLIGHEARVSLQGIDSFVTSLKNSSVSMEHLPTVQIIGSQANTLSQSISDFIFSARILSGDRDVKTKVFTPPEYKTRMLPVWKDIIGSRDVALSLDISPNLPPILVDTFFLETAIGQIVKIALQQTRIGTIEIEMSEEKSLRGMRLNVSIEDTGSGMSDEDRDSLFDFFEVDDSGVSKVSHNQPLGFAIAKKAVEAMNGAMTVHSRLGRGTRVTFTIPVKKAAANDLLDNDDVE